MAEQLPPNFDWVTRRAQCSAVQMFEVLRTAAKENVDQRNRTLGHETGDAKALYGFNDGAERSFTVFATYGRKRRAVDFYLSNDGVLRIEPFAGAGVELGLTLTDDAVCRLTIGAEILDPWQVLRRVLEPLLFEDYKG